MRIAIDCRYLGMSGIGRYTESILTDLDGGNEYIFIGKREKIEKYISDGGIVEDGVSPFSVKGLFPRRDVKKAINSCDVYFTPNFIIPFGIKIPVFSVIHDVIFMDMRTETTNGYFDYRIKKYLFGRCMRRSRRVFTVSGFSASRIRAHFGEYADKVVVAYNCVPVSVAAYADLHKLPAEKRGYMVYCGNIKKHKGLSVLMRAYELLRKEGHPLGLKIVGEASGHRTSDTDIMQRFSLPGVEFTGRLEDDELYDVIAGAEFLIQPSFYEGFGMPPLEAVRLRTKPIISDIEVFREVYGGMDVCFFESGNACDLADKIKTASPECDGSVKREYEFPATAEKIFRVIGEDL